MLEAILRLRDEHRKDVIGTSGPRINMWKKLCTLSNDLLTLRDPHGKPLFPHTLPQNAASLKRKCQEYEAACRISREEGYRYLIHKNFGNKSAAVVKDEESEAILHKLISLHNNLNSVQIMEEYNKVAEILDKPLINSPVTVDNYKKKMELTTMQGRKGKKVCCQYPQDADTPGSSYASPHLLDAGRLDGGTAVPEEGCQRQEGER